MTEPVTFPSFAGHQLAGRLDQPDGAEPIAFAVFAHCFSCSKDIKSINWISKGLAERGVAVLRFDFSGLGDSQGQFAETSFSTNIEDILAAAEFLRTRFRAPEILIGHSLGGTAMLAAAPRVAECRLVVTIAAPAEARHIGERLIREYPHIMHEGFADVSFGGRTVRIRREFLDDLERHDIAQEVANLNKSLIVFHASSDQTLEFEHGQAIFNAALPPKSFVCLEGADHLLITDERDSRYVSEVIAAWAQRYLKDKE